MSLKPIVWLPVIGLAFSFDLSREQSVWAQTGATKPAATKPAAAKRATPAPVTDNAKSKTAKANDTVKPATIAEVKAAIDLSKLPLAAGAEAPKSRGIGMLQYATTADSEAVYEIHRKQLVDLKWKEDTDGLAARFFRRDGFLVVMTAFNFSGKTQVTIENCGNVLPASLPVPAGATVFIALDKSIAYNTKTPAPAASKAVQKLLQDQGWKYYGQDSVSQFFRQNAVLVNVMVSEPMEPNGPTTITYSTTVLTRDLPSMTDATDLEVSEGKGTLKFNTKAKPPAVAAFYIKELDKSGWKPATKGLVKNDSLQTLAFNNPQKETLTLQVSDDDGQTQVELKVNPQGTAKK